MNEQVPVYDDELYKDWTSLLKVACHPVRLKVLHLLMQGARCVTDVNEFVDVSQPNLSQHLTALREGGLVASHTSGPKRCYYLLRPGFVETLFGLLKDFSMPVERSREDVVAEAQSNHDCPDKA